MNGGNYINGYGHAEHANGYENGNGPHLGSTMHTEDAFEGIVYRREVRRPYGALDAEKYAFVWSTNGERAIVMPAGGKDYKPGAWLRYHLWRDSVPIMDDIWNYAIDAEEIKPPVPGNEFRFTVKVHATVLIRRQRPPEDGGAYSGWTEALGLVFVPADASIKRRLEEEEQFEAEASPVERITREYLLLFLAVVIYAEEQNRWWLATVVDYERLTWTNLNGLPTLLADLLLQAEQIPCAAPIDLRPISSATGAQSVATWVTPKDWDPVVTRATDLWGVTVPSSAQSDSTLVYTSLGVLEIPRLSCVIGAWLLMAVTLKDATVTSESEALRVRQNSAPIQTRVLQEGRVVVFSGTVMRGEDGSWLNDYLGLVEDPQKLIPEDPCPERLVELAYVDDGGRPRLEVIKYHRLHVAEFEASVIDKESFYREEGDYAHQDEAIRAYGRMLEAKHPEVDLGESSGRLIGPEVDNIIAVDDFSEGLQETSFPAGEDDIQGRAPTEEDSEDNEDPYSDPSDGSTSGEPGPLILRPSDVLPPPTNITSEERPWRIQTAAHVEDSGGSGQREGGFGGGQGLDFTLTLHPNFTLTLTLTGSGNPGGGPPGASSGPRQGLAAQHRNVQLPAALSNAQLSIINTDDYSEQEGGIATSYPAIVVSTRPNYAVLYTDVYGLAILKREIFASDDDYQHFVGLGKWINADMYPVEDYNPNVHAFRYICTGGVPVAERIPTTVEGRFVKLFSKCDFREEKLQKVSGDYRVRFEMGWAVCSASLLTDLALLNRSDVTVWMVYVKWRPEHDCHWKILGTDAYVRDKIKQATRQVPHKSDDSQSSTANGDPSDSMNQAGSASDFRPANADVSRGGSSSQRCNVAAPRAEVAFVEPCADDFRPSNTAQRAEHFVEPRAEDFRPSNAVQRGAATSLVAEFVPPDADDFRPSNAAQRVAAPQTSCFAVVRSADVYHPTEAQLKAVSGDGERDHNENIYEPPAAADFQVPAAGQRSASSSEGSDSDEYASAEDRSDEAEFREPNANDFRPSSTKVDAQQRSTQVENSLDEFLAPSADAFRPSEASADIEQHPPWLDDGVEDEPFMKLAPERVKERLRCLLFDPEPDMADLEEDAIDSEEDDYEADDGADAFIDSDVECVIDGDVPRRWETALAGTDSSFMASPSADVVAGCSAETVDDPEQRPFAPDPTAHAFFCPVVPTADNSAGTAQRPPKLIDDESSSGAPTDPNQSSSALTNGSDDGPTFRFGFPRLPSRTISRPMNRLVRRANNQSITESDNHATHNAALQQRVNATAPPLIADEPFGVGNDAWQQPSDTPQHGAAEPSWQPIDAVVAAPHSAAPMQRTNVDLFDALIDDEIAPPSERAVDLLSFDLVDNGSAATRGRSTSQVQNGIVTLSNAVGSAATPCDYTPFVAAAPHRAAPTQRAVVNLLDAPIADAVAVPSQRSADLLSFDLVDIGGAVPRGGSASQVPSGTVSHSNTVGSAATPCDCTPFCPTIAAAAPSAVSEPPDFIDWDAPSPPQRSSMQRDIAAATNTNRQLMAEIVRSNYQPAPRAEDVRSEDMPIDTTPRDGMAMLADDIEEMKIRATRQLKCAVNRDFRRKTLRDMQQEQHTLRQIESRRASSRASSRASTAMGNAVRLPQFVDMFAQAPVSDEDETGLEDVKPTRSSRSTTIHQPLPIRPGLPAAARHNPFGDQALFLGGSMTKFDVPAQPPSGPPTRSSTLFRNEPRVNVVAPPATGHNAVNSTAANFNNASTMVVNPLDL